MAIYDPNIYNKVSYHTSYAVADLFKDVKDKLSWKEKEIIMDFGCGNGVVTTNVLRKFIPADATIIGIDIVETMINYAKKHFSDSKTLFKVADIADSNVMSSWQEEQFTKVTSFFVMHRIKDDSSRQIYENIYKLLMPGGEILLFTPVSHGMDAVSPYLSKIPKYSAYAEKLAKMRALIEPRENPLCHTCDVLKEIGYEITLSKSMNTAFDMKLDDFPDFYGCVSYLSQILPEDLLQEALKDSRKIIEEHKLFEEPPIECRLNLELLVIIAEKPC